MAQKSMKLLKFVARLTLTAMIGVLAMGCFPVPWGDDDDDDAHDQAPHEQHERDLYEQSQSRSPTIYAHAAATARTLDASRSLGA